MQCMNKYTACMYSTYMYVHAHNIYIYIYSTYVHMYMCIYYIICIHMHTHSTVPPMLLCRALKRAGDATERLCNTCGTALNLLGWKCWSRMRYVLRPLCVYRTLIWGHWNMLSNDCSGYVTLERMHCIWFTACAHSVASAQEINLFAGNSSKVQHTPIFASMWLMYCSVLSKNPYLK